MSDIFTACPVARHSGAVTYVRDASRGETVSPQALQFNSIRFAPPQRESCQTWRLSARALSFFVQGKRHEAEWRTRLGLPHHAAHGPPTQARLRQTRCERTPTYDMLMTAPKQVTRAAAKQGRARARRVSGIFSTRTSSSSPLRRPLVPSRTTQECTHIAHSQMRTGVNCANTA